MKAKPKQPTPRQRRSQAENKLAEITAKAQAVVIEKAVALLESQQAVRVPWEEYPQYDTWGMPRIGSFEAPYIWTNPDDCTEGRYRPYYENAHDVRRMRAEWRTLARLPVAQSALRKLSDYIIGTGWEFSVRPKKRWAKDPGAMQLASTLQRLVDRFLEYNKFVGNLDRQMHETSRIDGSIFPTLYPEGDCVRLEMVDPGCILEPTEPRPLEAYIGTGHKLNSWWHGVHTVWNHQLKRDDVARPLGYHAVFDRMGDSWDYLSSSQVQHIKRNVVENLARVGVGDFFFVASELLSEAKIRRNTAEGAAILAAIVMIREHAEGVSKSSIESMVTTGSTSNYQKSIADGTRTTHSERLQPGTVKDIPHGMKSMMGPMGTLNQPVYVMVSQYVLRVLGGIWSMPEYMISGDASNGNYASTLVAESPFVKYCEHEQAFYASHYEALIWKALRMMRAAADFSWPQVMGMIDINAEYTSPATRDKKEQVEVNKALNDAGIMSDATFAADHGLDLDEEKLKGAAKAPPPPTPFGPPSGNGSPFGARKPAYNESDEHPMAGRAMALLEALSGKVGEPDA